MATTNINTDSAIAAKDFTGRPIAHFDKSDFDNANRRFTFTMSNRTGLTFIMDQTNVQFGAIETPWRELGVGNADKPSELRIRGYKTNLFHGVSCTLRFRIHNEKGEDTKLRLKIFVEIGVAVRNSFGWYVDSDDTLLKAKEWFEQYPPEKIEKTDAEERNLIKGNSRRMHATLNEQNLDIEMFTDNFGVSFPTMIIKCIQKNVLKSKASR